MQLELLNENPATAIHLLGINTIASVPGNEEMCNGRDIPWLQDTPEERVWASWEVTLRDVVILDENNIRVAVYNLTQHDLNLPSNYAELKCILEDIAGEVCISSLGDSDGDCICNDGNNNGITGDNPCTGGNIQNCDDNCPVTPNGLLLGTCVKIISGVPVSTGVSCTNGDCEIDEICQISQEDFNGNGIGDACECYYELNCNNKVDLPDLVIMKANFSVLYFLSDLVIMKSQFGRTDCPACP